MHRAENVNAPWLGGFVIGAAAGLVAFAVLVVLGDFDLFPAAAMAAVVATVVGLILGLPWGSAEPAVYLDRSDKASGAGHHAAPAVVAEAVVAPAAVMSAPVMSAPVGEGPLRLSAPRNGVADNLKELEGVGPAMEKLANELGFYHFDQIAAWTDADVALVDAEMKGFKGRITRDKWVAQARIIVTEGLEAFRERAKTNNY